MVNKWSNIGRSWLFPVDCLYCGGKVVGQLALCNFCQQSLRRNNSACTRCAEPLADSQFQILCGKCLKKAPEYDQVLSPYLYQPPISTLITRFKYHADLGAGYILGKLLADYLQDQQAPLPECIVPVPLHSSRLRQRGFNQSLELSRVLGKHLAVPVLQGACVRHRQTDSQSGLNEKQRKQNIRGAFSTSATLPYQHVAIVDDVMTTGNTANELAKILRKAGAETIQVWSVCRASNWKV